jgi:hypothetical protein
MQGSSKFLCNQKLDNLKSYHSIYMYIDGVAYLSMDEYIGWSDSC